MLPVQSLRHRGRLRSPIHSHRIVPRFFPATGRSHALIEFERRPATHSKLQSPGSALSRSSFEFSIRHSLALGEVEESPITVSLPLPLNCRMSTLDC